MRKFGNNSIIWPADVIQAILAVGMKTVGVCHCVIEFAKVCRQFVALGILAYQNRF